MPLPIQLISTDFDGTLFAEFENPPIPHALQEQIRRLQQQGAKWVINTGREMASLMESLARGGIGIEPDHLILVEREIYCHQESKYQAVAEWNAACALDHERLFARLQPDLKGIYEWINARFHARVYEDPYSPFCLIASSNSDADIIHKYLEDYAAGIPELTVVRNDVYARFSHTAYNKGTALAELTQRLGLTRDAVFTVGDHLNDLPMLSRTYARCLGAPANAVERVKQHVRQQGGYVSELPHGHGVLDSIQHYLEGNCAEK
ncbi:MAG TPA: HAD family hydrolase [Verrucomicrobiae bacterium]|nr:HAD family hydrolase [Verrucomicrobiae bacterium]